MVSENSANLEVMFTFDTEVMASAAYRGCFKSLVKQNLRTPPNAIELVSNPLLNVETRKGYVCSRTPRLQSKD